jgi:peptidoglycan/LPS O-acetylase OafA/YrhL
MALDASSAVDMERSARRAHVAASEAMPQIPALTGLRFFAAFFILFAHAGDWLAQFQNSNIGEKLGFTAMYGMPLFFVLSGFVIHYNYGRLFMSRGIARATCEFAAARFARLFPLYIFLLLIAIFADDFVSKIYNRWEIALEILSYAVTLTQSWWYIIIEKQLIIYWLFPVSWSISTEMFFYLAYVATVFILLRLRGPRSAVIAAITFAVGVTSMFLATRYYMTAILSLSQRYVTDYIDLGANFEHSYYRWLFYFSPYTRVFEFFMGCLTAHACIALRSRPISSYEQQAANFILILALAGLVLFGAIYLHAIHQEAINLYVQHLARNFLCAPTIAFIMFYVARYETSFTRFMASPTLVALGETSYSIYLIHTWTLRLFVHPAPTLNWIWGLDAGLRILLGIVLTLMLAYATYRLIEVPSRVWLRRKLIRVIAAWFGSSQLDVTTDLPPAPHARLFFSSSAISLLLFIAVAGQVARSDTVWSTIHRLRFGDRPEIDIISATYGLNCKDFSVPAPFPNLAAPGNVTKPMQHACNSQERCVFPVDISRIGDPANGCGKDFSVEYRCTGSDTIKSTFLPPEAHGKSLILDCEAAR